METQSKFKVGLDVGIFGRWSRLGWGLLILIPLILQVIDDLSRSVEPLMFYGTAAIYLLGITLAYTAVYWFLGERFFATANPWINTAILVGPAFVLAWWNFIFYPLTGIQIPFPLAFAMGIYIGISFILQWRIKYGGCEVVSIPILLFKRRYTTYCVPLVALDAVEKVVVERRASQSPPAKE